MKDKYKLKIISTIWSTLKVTRDTILRKFIRLSKKKDEKRKNKYNNHIDKIKNISLKDMRLLIPLILKYQIEEDIDIYWSILSTTYGLDINDYNNLIQHMYLRLKEKGEDIDESMLTNDNTSTFNTNVLYLYETIHMNKPHTYVNMIDSVIKIINTYKNKSILKQTKRQENKKKNVENNEEKEGIVENDKDKDKESIENILKTIKQMRILKIKKYIDRKNDK